jgi:TolB protein
VWSPDETKIAFASDRAGQPSRYDIYVMNSDGTSPIRLTTNGGSEPSWSPDGKTITFVSDRDSIIHGVDQIYIMDSSGNNQKRLTNTGTNFSPEWSPDGRQIAFVHDSTVVASGTSGTPNPQICVMNRDGSNIVQLLYPSAQNYSPIWSPDGTKIIFVSSGTGPNYAHHIYIMDNNGENMHLWVTSNNEDTSPCWSPNGTKMVFVSSRAGLPEIYTMNADGSNQIRLTDRTSGIDFSKPQPGGLMIGDFSPNW